MKMRKNVVEQTKTQGRKLRLILESVAVVAILASVFVLDWHIAGLKESEQKQSVKLVYPTSQETSGVIVVEENIAEVENAPVVNASQALLAEADAAAHREKVLTNTKDATLGGCRTAQDFINVNLLMQEVSDYENFTELLKSLRFENGEIQYPPVSFNGAQLLALKAFFDKVPVFNEKELEQCVVILHDAQDFKLAVLSYDVTKELKKTSKAG